jgi:hypothetical protein
MISAILPGYALGETCSNLVFYPSGVGASSKNASARTVRHW